jgi:PAS domain S-box-containing protein
MSNMAKNDPIPVEDQSLSLRQIIDSAAALIHTGRPDGHLDFFNQTWLRYVWRSLEDLQGWKWAAFIHPEDVEGIVEKWRDSLASGEPLLHEAHVLRADGEYRWMLHHKVAALLRTDEEFVLYGGEHSNQPGLSSVPPRSCFGAASAGHLPKIGRVCGPG